MAKFQRQQSKLKQIIATRKFESVVVVIFVVLILLTAIGMSFVEPYQRLMFVAMLPSQLLMGFFQALMFAGIYSYMFRGTGLPFTGSKIKPEQVNVRLSQVIGLKHVKQEVTEVIDFLKDHSELQNAGGRMLNGILFTGDPGTGKTLLAKAVATECDLPFIGISGASFVEMFVGVGAARVRDLFRRARELADEHGGCVVFIDEFDALAKTREYTPYGSMEDNRTINQFLEKMDGVAGENAGILVIAATNARVETLDPAITRPGRFDRHIEFTKPNLEDRLEMLKHYSQGKPVSPGVDLLGLARNLSNSSGADIENLVNEAVLIFLRRKGSVMTDSDFGTALERLKLGVERRISLTADERRAIAIHESGHALAERAFSKTSAIYKVSIVPRGGSLGVMWSEDRNERHLHLKSEMESRIRVLLGGYAAERAMLGESSNGVTNDLQHATRVARTMVTQLGMGGFIGSFGDDERSQLSETFRARLDLAVQDVLQSALRDVEDYFTTPSIRVILSRLADSLVEKEELDAAQVDALLTRSVEDVRA